MTTYRYGDSDMTKGTRIQVLVARNGTADWIDGVVQDESEER